MATTSTIPAAAPPAAAPAAATAATSSPAATPTAPASSPASTSPTSTPVVDGASGAGALTHDQSIHAMVEAAKKGGYQDTSIETPAAVPEPVATEPVAATDPAADALPAGEDGFEGYTLEDDGFVGARDLAAKIDADPALKTALPKELRDEIMANSRLAEKGAKYSELFASPQEAEMVVQHAQEFAAVAETFNLAGRDVQKGTSAFIQKLIEFSALRDEQGNLVKNDDGTYKTDGTAGKLLTAISQRWFGLNVADKVKALGDENVQAAFDLVMESVGLRPSTADKTENQDPELARREADITAREQKLANETRETRQKTATEYNESLRGDLTSLYEKEQGLLLSAATGLSALERSAVEGKLEKAVAAAIKGNVAYQRRKNQLEQQPMSATRRQEEVKLAREFLRDNLPRIARPILTEAGVVVGKRVADKAAAQAARAESARSDVGGGIISQPVARTSEPGSAQQAADVKADMTAKLGRVPDDSEVRIEMMMRAVNSKGRAA